MRCSPLYLFIPCNIPKYLIDWCHLVWCSLEKISRFYLRYSIHAKQDIFIVYLCSMFILLTISRKLELKRLHDAMIQWWGKVNWLFNVTINDISVIYVTAHRCAGVLKKKLDLRSSSQRHRHFIGFFNVLVQAQTQGHSFFFYGYSEKLPHLVTFYDTLGIQRTHPRLNPRVPTGTMIQNDIKNIVSPISTFLFSSTVTVPPLGNELYVMFIRHWNKKEWMLVTLYFRCHFVSLSLWGPGGLSRECDFGYVCTGTLTLEIWPWVKVMIHPWVKDNTCVKDYPDQIWQ